MIYTNPNPDLKNTINRFTNKGTEDCSLTRYETPIGAFETLWELREGKDQVTACVDNYTCVLHFSEGGYKNSDTIKIVISRHKYSEDVEKALIKVRERMQEASTATALNGYHDMSRGIDELIDTMIAEDILPEYK